MNLKNNPLNIQLHNVKEIAEMTAIAIGLDRIAIIDVDAAYEFQFSHYFTDETCKEPTELCIEAVERFIIDGDYDKYHGYSREELIGIIRDEYLFIEKLVSATSYIGDRQKRYIEELKETVREVLDFRMFYSRVRV